MKDDQIKHMVNRFLMWRFPSNLCPDGGIKIHPAAQPVGTNLLSATQADGMVRHMIDGLWQPIETAPRDGTPFLCFHPDDVFSDRTGIDLVWYEPSIKTYTMDGDNEVPFAGITHWMPLPTPPQR